MKETNVIKTKNNYTPNIDITSQAELDMIPLDYDGTIHILANHEGYPIYVNNSYKNAKIIVSNHAYVVFPEISYIDGLSTVIAENSSLIRILRKLCIIAKDDSTVFSVNGGSIIVLLNNSIASVNGDETVIDERVSLNKIDIDQEHIWYTKESTGKPLEPWYTKESTGKPPLEPDVLVVSSTNDIWLCIKLNIYNKREVERINYERYFNGHPKNKEIWQCTI